MTRTTKKDQTKQTRNVPVVLAGGGEATALTVLVRGIADPVDPGIVTDLGMGWIDHDDLIVLHGSILVDPVAIENAKITKFPSDLLFGHRL